MKLGEFNDTRIVNHISLSSHLESRDRVYRLVSNGCTKDRKVATDDVALYNDARCLLFHRSLVTARGICVNLIKQTELRAYGYTFCK